MNIEKLIKDEMLKLNNEVNEILKAPYNESESDKEFRKIIHNSGKVSALEWVLKNITYDS